MLCKLYLTNLIIVRIQGIFVLPLAAERVWKGLFRHEKEFRMLAAFPPHPRHQKSQMALAIDLSCFCSRCCRPLLPSTGGFILSCSDFLCTQCAESTSFRCTLSTCPACGKQGVQGLNLNGSLPNEVSSRMTDPVHNLDTFKEALSFQLKYYKQTTKKMFAKIQALSRENRDLKQ